MDMKPEDRWDWEMTEELLDTQFACGWEIVIWRRRGSVDWLVVIEKNAERARVIAHYPLRRKTLNIDTVCEFVDDIGGVLMASLANSYGIQLALNAEAGEKAP